jgi:sugar lactone lactonase YvrE
MSSSFQSPRTITQAVTIERIAGPSRLYGANGLRTGKDGRIYVAQVVGSQVSAINIDSGEIEVISAMGDNIVAPDDLAFDDHDILYITEITRGRVSALEPNGRYRVILDDLPCANPITFHQGHLYTGQCLPGGRIMELDRNGGSPRTILKNVPMPNAFEIGPDGKLYFPVMGANEIWRVDPQGGVPEVVATGLGVPDSVKFDAKGNIVSTQVASGEVLRIDPKTGQKTVLARLPPGLDNCTFVGDRLFVSSMSGEIVEIVEPGKVTPLIPEGFQWPMGLAASSDGTVFIADGAFTYALERDGSKRQTGNLFSAGYPGFARGVAYAAPGEWVVTTANGDVARFWPAKNESAVLASGHDQPMGVAVAANGTVVFAVYGSGKIIAVADQRIEEIASQLDRPVAVAMAPDGSCYATEAGAGRVLKITGHRIDTVLDGLSQPEGIACHGNQLYIVDSGARTLIQYDMDTRQATTIASGLPVGGPPGRSRTQLGGIGTLSGPMTAFTGLTVDALGTIYLSGDAEGSVLAIRQQQTPRL